MTTIETPDERERTRRILKEKVYTRYTDIVKILLEKEYYGDFEKTITTFLALNMCSEAAKNNLLKMGADVDLLEKSRRAMIAEIWHLMDAYDNGSLKTLVEEARAEQAEKK